MTQYTLKLIRGTIPEAMFYERWEMWFIRVRDRSLFMYVKLGFF